jgi:hypothetical protein
MEASKMSNKLIQSAILSVLLLFGGLAHADLKFPGDCKASKIMKAAKKGGCTVEMGAKHHKIKKGGKVITLLPNTVKPNGTCRGIINSVNAQCK